VKASKRAKNGKSKSAGKTPERPSRYRPEFVDHARKLCRLGATDKELAEFFGVAESTLAKWKLAHWGFSESLKEGKSESDAEVADRLFKRATGYSHKDTKFATFEGKIRDSKEYVAARNLPSAVGP
jgi:hypothetical protein